ncbi:WD40 repeat protein [Zalaria obscura]|uniref:WD40 repeat protein n=1 Tax=Zalaria obscura TaxID=2024903 RepID=A0ACC3S5B8_9PEZI
MYWPIGAPRIYAASKHPTSGNSAISEDGLQEDTRSRTPSETVTRDGNNGDGAPPSLTPDHEESLEDEEGNRAGIDEPNHQEIVGVQIARSGLLFATITRSSLSIWQVKPTVVLATIVRSEHSLRTYGPNTALLLRPDALIVVVQTQLGYLITYSLATDPNARVYQSVLTDTARGHARQPSIDGYRKLGPTQTEAGPGEADGMREINIRFRMVIRIDAGIARAIVLDDELVVATAKPAAIQCIRWSPDTNGSSHSTELLKKMPWLTDKASISTMLYDRPMNLHAWITNDGDVYAVQRLSGAMHDPSNPKSLFRGYCFHRAENEGCRGIVAAINARFSLIAVGCEDACIRVYLAKDYLGNIPLSHALRLPVSMASSGRPTFLTFSPDGYCLFAGFENGWATWSVYGKPGASSFNADRTLSEASSSHWLQGLKDGFWIGAGCEIMLLGNQTDQLCLLELARSSVTGCYAFANISRSLIQASTSFMLYRGFDLQDVTSVSGDASLWQTVQVPANYLATQWPIRSTVISPDGRYVAVAGRKGLAHYSVNSGRWKAFEDPSAESEFSVRGGMCWYQHILVAAVEAGNSYQVRLYSREKALEYANVLHAEDLYYPVVYMTTTGDDSLLVYTYENVLLHYIFTPIGSSVTLTQVGQIAFHGIIRAPSRVRAINWVLPDDQRENGDPSQDVATAAVLFLVDGKLVLLQPSANEYGELKYDMRVIANDVEYYTLIREQAISSPKTLPGLSQTNGDIRSEAVGHSLRDSLWYFDGNSMRVWPDVIDVLTSAPAELGRELPLAVAVPTDFYPVSTVIDKGILIGVEADLVQRRDVELSYFKFTTRTHLIVPPLLRHHLAQFDHPSALHLAHSYQKLPYFAYALEVLLHNVLDEEVDSPPDSAELALLPSVLSFLSSFSAYLDIIVGCTRKTELRSWHTLFKYLPPVQQLFEESLSRGMLKTAGGFLLILHTFDEDSFNTEQIARLLRMAKDNGDWDLCKELARFLVGIDASGDMLRMALAVAGLRGTPSGLNGTFSPGSRNQSHSSLPYRATNGSVESTPLPGRYNAEYAHGNDTRNGNMIDYFSLGEQTRPSEGDADSASID